MDGRIKSHEMEEPNVKLEEGREKGVERQQGEKTNVKTHCRLQG